MFNIPILAFYAKPRRSAMIIVLEDFINPEGIDDRVG
jgi:hypothetical protein